MYWKVENLNKVVYRIGYRYRQIFLIQYRLSEYWLNSISVHHYCKVCWYIVAVLIRSPVHESRYLDSFSTTVSLLCKRWLLHSDDRVALLCQGEKLLNLWKAGWFGGAELRLQLLDAGGVRFLTLLPTRCQADVEIRVEGVQQWAQHVQAIGE